MKKNKLWIPTISLMLMSGVALNVFGATVGSEQDPLVSKSYVDGKISELITSINNNVGGGGNVQAGNTSATFKPVEIKSGTVLLGHEGTEIILRSGKAFIYSTSPDGITDTTGGLDLGDGNNVPTNHYLIIPRADGRGILSVTDCWVMIKGEYTIK